MSLRGFESVPVIAMRTFIRLPALLRWNAIYWSRYRCKVAVTEVTSTVLDGNSLVPGAPGSPFCWANLGSLHYAFRENAVVEIESEWTARDRELKPFGEPARIFLSLG